MGQLSKKCTLVLITTSTTLLSKLWNFRQVIFVPKLQFPIRNSGINKHFFLTLRCYKSLWCASNHWACIVAQRNSLPLLISWLLYLASGFCFGAASEFFCQLCLGLQVQPLEPPWDLVPLGTSSLVFAEAPVLEFDRERGITTKTSKQTKPLVKYVVWWPLYYSFPSFVYLDLTIG